MTTMSLPLLLLLVMTILANNGSGLGSAAAAVTESGRLYSRAPDLSERTFEGDLLFVSPARSRIHCAILCSRHCGCRTLSFHQGACRGHSVFANQSTLSTPAPGAQAFIRELPGNRSRGPHAQSRDGGSLVVFVISGTTLFRMSVQNALARDILILHCIVLHG